ncbi:copper resistance protein B [Pseudomonas turukhanskensis]|uniref:Copper resistance protein B n=1 Tax=Pseudomonas turukhanskensis TaxID=1806536 RepID=A0A9W6K8I6_9PSED|nr:copper resistance protein B [Pseudomonas turukhanskensis]GLK89645.1 copper resistance protein B [Pseudomonas turukhanskensis]
MKLLTCAALAATLLNSAHAAEAMDHSMHGMSMPGMDMSGMDHDMSAGSTPLPAASESRTPIAPLTDADRQAAFPALHSGHDSHEHTLNSYVLIDRLEWQNLDAGNALAWDIDAWLGGDIDRLVLRSEGERVDGRTDNAELQALWGHAISPWWDVVLGARQDFKPGPAQTWAALGIQGTPLYGLETEATAYLGENNQSALRLKAEYNLLLTQRLVLQPLAEANFYGKDDAEREVGAGLATTELGLRLRYHLRPEIAPYVGLTWNKSHGHTAAEEDDAHARLVVGIRLWF